MAFSLVVFGLETRVTVDVASAAMVWCLRLRSPALGYR